MVKRHPIGLRSTRWAAAFLVAALAALVTAPSLQSQESAATPDSSVQEQATGAPAADARPVELISSADFVREEERAQALLDSVRTLLLPDPGVQAVVADLRATTELINELIQRPEVINPSRYPVRRISNLRGEWSVYAGLIDGWQSVLSDRIRDLERARNSLADFQARAIVTDSVLASRGGSEFIQLRIRELGTEVDALRTLLIGEIDGTLAIQQRVIAEGERVSDQLGVFDASVREAQRQLLVADAPPIWSVVTGGQIMAPARVRGESLPATIAALRSFYEDNRRRLLFQLALTAFMAVGLLVFKRRARSWGQVEAIRNPLHVLEHPVSAAVISGLLLTIPLYQAPPHEVGEIAVLISVPAVILLLRGLVGAALRPALYFLSGMVVLDLVAATMDWVPVLGRLVVFVETLLGVVGGVWLLRKDSPVRPSSPTRWWRAVLFAARIGTAALVLSAVANLLGNRSLAELLTSGVVRAAYLGLVLFAGALVGRGLVALIPRTKVGQSLHGVRRHADLVVHNLQRPVDFVAVLVWLWLTGRLFSMNDAIGDWIQSTLGHVWSFGSLDLSLGGVVLFVFSVWLTFKISSLTRFVLTEEILDRLDLPRGVGGTISTVTHYVILLVGIVVSLAVAGIDVSRITIIAGALGVGIGFGLQGLVNNFVSGLILIFERPISVGDTVAIGAITGKVGRIGMRSTTVQTYDGAEVIVPNGSLIANDVINWTLTDRKRRVEVAIGAAYGSDPNHVMAVLRKTAEDQPDLLAFPEPLVLFMGFGDSSLDFSVRAWVRTFEDHLRVRSELAAAVNEAFAAEGISIPFPQRDLHIKSGDQDAVAAGIVGEDSASASEVLETGSTDGGDTELGPNTTDDEGASSPRPTGSGIPGGGPIPNPAAGGES